MLKDTKSLMKTLHKKSVSIICVTWQQKESQGNGRLRKSTTPTFFATRVTLSKEGTVGRVFTTWFRENITRQALQEYWQCKYVWDDQTMSNITGIRMKAHIEVCPQGRRLQ